ncbi:hypothetical protein [Namhaeicola litoreus]|uniref:Lipoprotein n=1 Tax=Namhaeicola litoreus TaxID=1052145 RepID=A0ABW3Y5I0_9FLAO
MTRKLLLLLMTVVLWQCGKEKEFVISKDQVGPITKTSSKEDILSFFKNDSIVMLPPDRDFANEFVIYDDEGKHLLSVYPRIPKDSLNYIERVQIYSPKFKTEKGISVASNYGDVASNYSFTKIDPTFTSAIIYVDEINGSIVLEKSDLGLSEDNLDPISKDQIPDLASIKYISIWFE